MDDAPPEDASEDRTSRNTDPASEEPALESRREIFAAIRKTPGIHFRALLRQLPYAQGTLQYHIRQLRNQGLLDEEDDGEFTRYYPSDTFEPDDKTVMNALRREYSRRIVAHLAADGPLTTTELADRLDKSPSTVSWHLSRLREADLVSRERDGRSVPYALTDPDRVTRLYTIHRKSFADRLVDRLLDIWSEY